jgi:putative hemolysin
MLMMYRSVSAKSEIPVEEVSEEITGSVIGMANPASVYCEEQGGTVTIVKDEN